MADLPYSGFDVGGLIVGNPQGDRPYILTELNPGGKPEASVGDKDRPREDGLFFGRDLLAGRLVSIGGSVSTDGNASARTAWDTLAATWDADETRLTPGGVTTMRIRMHGGPTRVVYGRPRELDPVDDPGYSMLDYGRLDFVGQFRAIDHLFYDDVEQTETFGITSGGTPGLRSPLKSPLTSRVPGNATLLEGRIDVGGTQAAWPQITIYGPITNPAWFDIGRGWLQLSMTLKYDDYVTISTAPWNRSARLNGVTNVAGALTAQSLRLSRARLEPGTHQVVLRGISDTGTARMTTSWRNSYSSCS